MAFVALSLSTQEILETTYVSDMRIISNSNTGLLKSKVEDLINNLKIDLSDKKIGVDPDTTLTPLTELKTKKAASLTLANQLPKELCPEYLRHQAQQVFVGLNLALVKI